MLLKFTGILVLLALAYTQTPPVWPNQFEINFDETTKEVSTFKTKGKIIYDWTGQREVVTREDGRGDRYCNTVEKFTSTPCNHYILAGTLGSDFRQALSRFPNQEILLLLLQLYQRVRRHQA